MRRLTRSLSRGFVGLMILLGSIGVGLWLLAKIAVIASGNGVTAPVGAVASRYRRFAQTGG